MFVLRENLLCNFEIASQFFEYIVLYWVVLYYILKICQNVVTANVDIIHVCSSSSSQKDSIFLIENSTYFIFMMHMHEFEHSPNFFFIIFDNSRIYSFFFWKRRGRKAWGKSHKFSQSISIDVSDGGHFLCTHRVFIDLLVGT